MITLLMPLAFVAAVSTMGCIEGACTILRPDPNPWALSSVLALICTAIISTLCSLSLIYRIIAQERGNHLLANGIVEKLAMLYLIGVIAFGTYSFSSKKEVRVKEEENPPVIQMEPEKKKEPSKNPFLERPAPPPKANNNWA